MKRHHKQQNGFTLVEVSIVVLLLALVTAAKLREESAELRSSIAKAQGQQLKTLNAGLYSYGMKHFQEIVNNTAVTGVAVTRAPTVTELVALGELTSGFSPNAYYGAGYVTSIVPAPTGCAPSVCNITGLVYLNQPINDPFTGTADGPSIGDAVMQIGADGGSSLRVPGTIQGTNGGWSVVNPLGATRGILAARSGLGSELDLTGYYKRDGSLPMSGNVDMGSNSIVNIKTVIEGSACATSGEVSKDASGALLSCQGGVQKRQGSNYWQDPVANFASLPACNAAASGQTRVAITPSVGAGQRAYNCNGASWVALGVSDTGNFVLPGTITTGKALISDVVTLGASCSPDGLVAKDSTGLLLSCQSGFWKKASGSGDKQTVADIDMFTGSRTVSAVKFTPTYYDVINRNVYKVTSSGSTFMCTLDPTTGQCGVSSGNTTCIGCSSSSTSFTPTLTGMVVTSGSCTRESTTAVNCDSNTNNLLWQY